MSPLLASLPLTISPSLPFSFPPCCVTQAIPELLGTSDPPVLVRWELGPRSMPASVQRMLGMEWIMGWGRGRRGGSPAALEWVCPVGVSCQHLLFPVACKSSSQIKFSPMSQRRDWPGMSSVLDIYRRASDMTLFQNPPWQVWPQKTPLQMLLSASKKWFTVKE